MKKMKSIFHIVYCYCVFSLNSCFSPLIFVRFLFCYLIVLALFGPKLQARMEDVMLKTFKQV